MSEPVPAPELLGLDPEAETVDRLAREVLRDGYQHLRLLNVSVSEDAVAEKVSVKARLGRAGTEDEVEVEGEGVGLVDAFFDSLLRAFASEHASLKTIEVADFEMRSGFDKAKGRKSDAEAEAVLRIRSSEGNEMTFRARTPSVTRSTLEAALRALNFFINSERAYIQLHRALLDAKERRRSDLVTHYRAQMSTLVGATSYSEVIDRLRKEAEG